MKTPSKIDFFRFLKKYGEYDSYMKALKHSRSDKNTFLKNAYFRSYLSGAFEWVEHENDLNNDIPWWNLDEIWNREYTLYTTPILNKNIKIL